MSLQKNLEILAADFVRNVLAALRSASLEDVAEATGQAARALPVAARRAVAAGAKSKAAAKAPAAKKGNGARLARRTPADIQQTIASIVTLLRDHPEGMRAEDIRKALGLEAREMPRPLQDGVASKALSRKGEKRATTYFATGAAPAEPKKAAGKGKKAKG